MPKIEVTLKGILTLVAFDYKSINKQHAKNFVNQQRIGAEPWVFFGYASRVDELTELVRKVP